MPFVRAAGILLSNVNYFWPTHFLVIIWKRKTASTQTEAFTASQAQARQRLPTHQAKSQAPADPSAGGGSLDDPRQAAGHFATPHQHTSAVGQTTATCKPAAFQIY